MHELCPALLGQHLLGAGVEVLVTIHNLFSTGSEVLVQGNLVLCKEQLLLQGDNSSLKAVDKNSDISFTGKSCSLQFLKTSSLASSSLFNLPINFSAMCRQYTRLKEIGFDT